MQKITLNIDGMACGMCEAHINQAIRNKFSVKKVTSSHTKKETVLLTEEDPSEEALHQCIGETGYTLLGIRRSSTRRRGCLPGASKRRIAVPHAARCSCTKARRVWRGILLTG